MTKSGAQGPLSIGEVLDGRYEIIRLIGQGNFSFVYRARQRVRGLHLRDVALKVFREGMVRADNVAEVFNDAVSLLYLLQEHPRLEVERHLVNIYDGGIDEQRGGLAYLAMELIEGRELTYSIAKHGGVPGIGGMPLELTLLYLRQILMPLAWMHSLKPPTVHGDLHPGNVLIDKAGEVKIVDFGLAARLPAAVFGGAIKYQAPETLLKTGGNRRFDVFALGLMWYEMLTGRHPFMDDDAKMLSLDLNILANERDDLKRQGDDKAVTAKTREIVAKQEEYIAKQVELRRTPPQPASEINNELAEHLALEDVLNRCLAFRQSDRYASAGQVQEAIDAYFDGHPRAVDRFAVAFGAKHRVAESDSLPEPESSPEMLLDRARRLHDRREFGRAVATLRQAIQKAPRHVPIYAEAAEIMLALAGDAPKAERAHLMEQAQTLLQQAKKMAPQDPRVLEVMADLYRAYGKQTVADSLTEKARQLRRGGAGKGR
ncbi:MAG: protein kinase [Candidatus Lernaella stagnicola]|nr:protein kinase [Candidatus Lernaella stagnicola]